MKNPIIHLACLMVASLPLNAAEEWHTFTDKTGRSFEGRVIAIDEDLEKTTVASRKTGRLSEIAFRVLSDSDITYLKNWEPEEPVTAEPETEHLGEASSRLYPRTKQEIRDRLRKIKSRDAPNGIDRDQQKTVNQLNMYRYLCGVPDDVEADPKMVEQATDAAEACKKHGGLSHSLGHSTNLCNLAAGGGMFASVKQYINDGGSNNRKARGHRRWCLNPPMGKTGFGEADRYSGMISMDSSGGKKPRDSWAYPGKGFFPKEYLHGNAWSLYLTERAPSTADIKVEVYKLRKRPQKKFSSSEEIPGKALPVEFISTYQNAINFEPQPQPITGRGLYWVRVKGGGVREGYLVELY